MIPHFSKLCGSPHLHQYNNIDYIPLQDRVRSCIKLSSPLYRIKSKDSKGYYGKCLCTATTKTRQNPLIMQKIGPTACASSPQLRGISSSYTPSQCSRYKQKPHSHGVNGHDRRLFIDRRSLDPLRRERDITIVDVSPFAILGIDDETYTSRGSLDWR